MFTENSAYDYVNPFRCLTRVLHNIDWLHLKVDFQRLKFSAVGLSIKLKKACDISKSYMNVVFVDMRKRQ
jgi:hypothetical protein